MWRRSEPDEPPPSMVPNSQPKRSSGYELPEGSRSKRRIAPDTEPVIMHHES